MGNANSNISGIEKRMLDQAECADDPRLPNQTGEDGWLFDGGDDG